MPERREAAADRTLRPTAPPGASEALASLPTVREVLTLDVVAAGRPEVFATDEALGAHVRWVHVSDSPGVARLLDGGELLLSTGQGWPAGGADLTAFVEQLADAGLSCLVLELGAHHRTVPPEVVDAARRRGLAVVALHREVRFVQLTEAVHRRIIADQTAAVRARDDVRTRFTSLALRGAPADVIVHQLAQTLAAPVVLENLAHEVVCADGAASVEDELLLRWESRSRAAHRAAATESGDWLIVPVEARGIRWGYLIALPGAAHPAGRSGVLEQGAIALALGRLTDADGEEWGRVGRAALVDDLLAGRFAAFASAAARLEAAGMPVDGMTLVGVVISGGGAALRAGADRAVDAAATSLGGRALVAGSGSPDLRILLSVPARLTPDDAVVGRFVREITASAPGVAPDGLVVAVGAAAAGLEAGLASLHEAIDLSRGGLGAGGRGRAARGMQIRRSDDRPLARLVTSLRDDHRLLEHGERMLAPLIEYDLARGGDLLDVLGAMLAHPGNRTAAASASHLSRSVFYQRIALIQELLDVDLDDGEVLTALHLALLVRRSAAGR